MNIRHQILKRKLKKEEEWYEHLCELREHNIITEAEYLLILCRHLPKIDKYLIQFSIGKDAKIIKKARA